MELWAKYAGQIGQATKLLSDAGEYAKHKKDARQYQQIVAEQLGIINNAIKNLNADRRDAIRKMDGYQDVVQAIDMICANGRPADSPLLTAGYVSPSITGEPTVARCQALSQSPSQGSCYELKYCAQKQAQISIQWLQQNRAALAQAANQAQGQFVTAVLNNSNRIANAPCNEIQSIVASEKATTITGVAPPIVPGYGTPAQPTSNSSNRCRGIPNCSDH